MLKAHFAAFPYLTIWNFSKPLPTKLLDEHFFFLLQPKSWSHFPLRNHELSIQLRFSVLPLPLQNLLGQPQWAAHAGLLLCFRKLYKALKTLAYLVLNSSFKNVECFLSFRTCSFISALCWVISIHLFLADSCVNQH